MRARERMRRWWLLCLAVVALSHGAFAQRVSRETAQSVAETFFNKNVRAGQAVHFTDITAETPFQNFYIFSADSGFVIVAADERVTPILGYSKTNRFVTEDMPENLRWWLEEYSKQIQDVKDNSIPASMETKAEWNALKSGNPFPSKGNRSNAINGLPTWDQWSRNDDYLLYNDSCPIDAIYNKHCVTGCAATAMAQIMRYWKYPTHGISSHSYTWNNQTLSANFGATYYDWEHMDTIYSSSSSEEARSAVATLMKHCGVAVDMDYGVAESSASVSPVPYKTYFDYSEVAESVYQVDYQLDDWIALLKNEIDRQRPINYYGRNPGGHYFICYGYDNNDMFKFNWGWGGPHNGDYYAIGALYDGYDLRNFAIVHIIPKNNNLSAPNGLEINLLNDNTIHLSWNVSPNAVSYIILRNGKYLTETEQTTYDDTNETYAGTFSYQIVSVGLSVNNMLPSVSLPSAACSYSIPYNTPVCHNLSAVASENAVNLSWVAPSNAISPIFHHQHPFNANNIKHTNSSYAFWFVDEDDKEPLVYEEFLPDEISSNIGKYITEMDVWVSTNHNILGEYYAVGKQHTVQIISGNEIRSTSFTPTSADTKRIILDNPIRVHNGNLRVYLQVEGAEDKKVFDYLEGSDGMVTAVYFDENKIPTQLGAGKHFIMYLYAKWANELTYNIYRNDGQHLRCIARNLQQPSYTDENLPAGLYSYYVTTNYYGGESEPSETVSIGYGNFTVATTSSPLVGGTVTGNQGSYPAGSTVTLTATANAGFVFNGWMENGQVVCNSPTYTFQALANRNLAASFVSTEFAIGSLVTNFDGSQGVVFYLEPSGTEGWMVALNDASEGCAWGEVNNVLSLREVPYNSPVALSDLSGYRNTGNLRAIQGDESEFAAAQVDYANGWYLPSVGQLRKLYSALPFIESAITAAGGTLMTEGTYWSSTEFSASDASTPMFALGNTNKTSNCRVRAIRNFITAGNNVVLVASNDNSMGTASVSGNGTFAYGAPVTVTAYPNEGYTFDHWSENGVAVSFDAAYQFSFARSRSLVANFSVPGSVGSIVDNADGSRGVVFWLSPDGDEGLMVALEDASEGCQWGEATDALSLLNKPFNSPMALEDVSGNTNTRCIKKIQNSNSEYAASTVDFANGWYLPSVGELRKLYAALPMIETALVNAGGSTLTEDTYWSSTEYSGSDAATATFSMGNTNKTSTCRVRAIRHFAAAGPNAITIKPNNLDYGTVTGSGEYTYGQNVTVTAISNPGYAFNTWTENGMIVSYDATYQFPFTRSRSLVANFVVPGSVGSIVTNTDGSRGVVFYADPSGFSGWMVALEDGSEGCAWGTSGEDVLVLDNLDPNPVYDLLSDMDGRRNSRILRGWFAGQSGYAADQVDYNNQWFLPTAGQLRKLYGALPLIEPTMINAGGVMMTEDAYWSSTERTENEAWSPSFAFGSSNKGENHRVRAIRSFYTANIQNPHIFVGTNGTLWSDPTNWINPLRGQLDDGADVIVTTQCVVDESATVKSLTMAYGSTISVDDGKILAATDNISNTYDTRINLGLGAQLVNPTEGAYFSMNKEITGYGNSEDGGWYTIATPLKNGMSVTPWTIGNYDLYSYVEPTHQWKNQKNGDNNFMRLENGQGYLYANAADQTLNFTGQAKSSTAEYTQLITNSTSAGLARGFNLLGNPFTSNLEICDLRINGNAISAYYKVSNGNALVAYTDADNEPIYPAEGFFIQGEAGTVSFNVPLRGNTANSYVRLVLFEDEMMLDRAYLMTNEGESLPKLRKDGLKAELYLSENGDDVAVKVCQEGVMEYPLCFKTLHDGAFTIASDLLNVECAYLHLIDNLTGKDIDLLATPSYTFEAKTTDSASRFVLVIRTSM